MSDAMLKQTTFPDDSGGNTGQIGCQKSNARPRTLEIVAVGLFGLAFLSISQATYFATSTFGTLVDPQDGISLRTVLNAFLAWPYPFVLAFFKRPFHFKWGIVCMLISLAWFGYQAYGMVSVAVLTAGLNEIQTQVYIVALGLGVFLFSHGAILYLIWEAARRGDSKSESR